MAQGEAAVAVAVVAVVKVSVQSNLAEGYMSICYCPVGKKLVHLARATADPNPCRLLRWAGPIHTDLCHILNDQTRTQYGRWMRRPTDLGN